jgi:hypothetical protein
MSIEEAIRRDTDELLRKLQRKGYTRLRNSLVMTLDHEVTIAEWSESLDDELRVLYDEIDATIPHAGLWVEAAQTLRRQQKEYGRGR